MLSSVGSLFRRKYETVKAVGDISFSISEGELVGFIGPNGAGKTTTLKCLSGLLYPTSGDISVLGYTPFERKTDYLKNISLVMGQKNQLWWDLPAIETFRLNKEIYDIPQKVFDRHLDELASLLEVTGLMSTPVRKLSLGQRMKMELIAALLHKPKVLFLDEPTIGLDVVMQKKVRDFIGTYNKQFTSTVLLTSHYMTDVKQLCRRLIIIDRGRIVYDGSLDMLTEKYAGTKTITAVFNKFVGKSEFRNFGEIKQYDPRKVILIVPRKISQKIALTLLKKFPVEDLNIEDPELEEIIREVFGKFNI